MSPSSYDLEAGARNLFIGPLHGKLLIELKQLKKNVRILADDLRKKNVKMGLAAKFDEFQDILEVLCDLFFSL